LKIEENIIRGLLSDEEFVRRASPHLDKTQPILSFHYYLIDGVIEDTATFEQEIGDLLVELIKEGLDRNEVIYHGGS
jgi:hypothetical protein